MWLFSVDACGLYGYPGPSNHPLRAQPSPGNDYALIEEPKVKGGQRQRDAASRFMIGALMAAIGRKESGQPVAELPFGFGCVCQPVYGR
jgi:hypothetical protein